MFCKNCGAELEDGALFCSACGAQTEPEKEDAVDANAVGGEEQAAVSVEEAGTAEAEPEAEEAGTAAGAQESETAEEAGQTAQRFCPNCGCENDEGDVFCRECGMSLSVAVQAGAAGQTRIAMDKKKLARKIAMGAACLAALVLVIWGVTHLAAGRSGGSSFVIYEKENELTAARKNKFEPVVVGDKVQTYVDENGNGSGMNAGYYIRYSESGDYLYYPQKCGDGEFDLYRKNLKKKKDTGTKLVSKIKSYILIDEDSFVYVKDSERNKLYLYHKGESEKIGSDVNWFRVSENGKYILWIADGDLRAQAAKFKAEQKKLDSDVTYLLGMSDDLKTIAYQKEDELYIMKDMKEAERIDRDVDGAYVCDMNGGCKIYYVKAEDADLSVLRGEGQTGGTAPMEAGPEEAPAAEAAPAAESASEWDDSFNPEDYVSESLTYYDLITDDLLAQDREIREPEWEDYTTTVYRDGDQDTEVDEAGYEEAYQRYEEKRKRDTMRRNLAGSAVGMNQWEVYYYDGGKGESSQVYAAHLLSDMGIFSDLMQDEALMFLGDVSAEQTGLCKFSELAEMDSWEAQSRITEQLQENARFLCLRNGQVSEVAQDEESGICSSVYANEKQHIVYLEYRENGRTAIYRYDYKAKGAVPELISDEVGYVVTVDMDKLCYVDEDSTLFYGDREVSEEASSFVVCDGNQVLYLTEEEDSEGTLMLFTGGENSVEVAENVLWGSYGLFDGKHVAYITDYSFKRYKGDMCVFMGKKGEIVDTDVNRIYFPEKEPDRGE